MDVKKSVAEAQAKFFADEAKNEMMPNGAKTLATIKKGNAGEMNKAFAKAMDLITGSNGYVNARDQLVAAGGDKASFLASVKPGRYDEVKGEKLMLKAAKGGHAGAMYQLCIMYLDKNKDSESYFWCLQAAKRGHAEAQITIGNKYWNEGMHGHSKDRSEAVLWIRLALAHGAIDIPDPRGEFLSKDSFGKGLPGVVDIGKKLYLERPPFSARDEAEEAKYNLNVKIAASCGCGAAMSTVTMDRERDVDDEN